MAMGLSCAGIRGAGSADRRAASACPTPGKATRFCTPFAHQESDTLLHAVLRVRQRQGVLPEDLPHALDLDPAHARQELGAWLEAFLE